MSRKQFVRRGARGYSAPRLGSPSSMPAVPSKQQLERAGIKILVGIPLERNVSDMAFLHFWQIAKQGYPLIERLYGRTDANRNTFARALLESSFTHLAMMDVDHAHQPDTIERMARWVMDDPDKLVVGGLHFRRGEPYDPCVFVMGDDGELHAPAKWEAGLLEVDAIGHGTLLISRKVFERLEQPYWAYSYAHVDKHIYPSEDMYFSWKCRENGIKLWADTTLTSPHLITGVVDESVFRAWLADNPDKVTQVNRKEASDE